MRNSKQIIGKQLRELRRQYKLTARDIAIRCRIAHPNLLNIENGKQNTTIDLLEKLANAVGAEITLTKKQYGMKIEEKQIELLKEIEKTGYLLSTEKDEDENTIAYKPVYQVIYWYKDEADPELIGEFEKISKALAKLPKVGDSKSEEYYEPVSELLVKFVEGYIDEDGDFIDSDNTVVPSELKGCNIDLDDYPVGVCHHQSQSRKLDEAFYSLCEMLETYITTELNGETFFCENEDSFVMIDSTGFFLSDFQTISLIGMEDEVVGCMKIGIDRKDRRVMTTVRYGKRKVVNEYDLLDLYPEDVTDNIKENIENLLNNNI